MRKKGGNGIYDSNAARKVTRKSTVVMVVVACKLEPESAALGLVGGTFTVGAGLGVPI